MTALDELRRGEIFGSEGRFTGGANAHNPDPCGTSSGFEVTA